MPTALDREIAEKLLDWYARCARDLPWRRTEDPYAIWVSEVMLQQTQVKTVVSYWERWMRCFPDVRSLAAAPESLVLKLWEGLGYYRRARNLHAAARQLVAENAGEFPSEHSAVLELKGVGRYTAGAICSIAFDQPVPIVDGNIARVLARWEMMRGDGAREPVLGRLWRRAEDLVCAAAGTGRSRACSRFNQALMELGALVCTPKSPSCLECPVSRHCSAFAAGRQESFPEARRRQETTSRFVEVAVIRCGGRFAVQRRPAGDVNGGFWEFPWVEVASLEESPQKGVVPILRHAGLESTTRSRGDLSLAPVTVVRHAITRYRITQRASLLEWPGRPPRLRGGLVWRTRQDLEALAFTSAHRKIVRSLPHPEGIAGRRRPRMGAEENLRRR